MDWESVHQYVKRAGQNAMEHSAKRREIIQKYNNLKNAEGANKNQLNRNMEKNIKQLEENFFKLHSAKYPNYNNVLKRYFELKELPEYTGVVHPDPKNKVALARLPASHKPWNGLYEWHP